MKKPDTLKSPITTAQQVIDAEPDSLGEVVNYLHEAITVWLPAEILLAKAKLTTLNGEYTTAFNFVNKLRLDMAAATGVKNDELHQAQQFALSSRDWGSKVLDMQREIKGVVADWHKRIEVASSLARKASEIEDGCNFWIHDLEVTIPQALVERMNRKRALQGTSPVDPTMAGMAW